MIVIIFYIIILGENLQEFKLESIFSIQKNDFYDRNRIL